MSTQIVVDISSDEEDHAAKDSNKTRSTGKQFTGSPRTTVKSPPMTSPTAGKPTVSAPVTAKSPEGPMNMDPRSQSADTSLPQIEQEASNNRAVSAAQAAASTSSYPPPPAPTTEQEPPKPTPLSINEFRHLVCAGSVPVKDAPLIVSIQPATPASHKRKATDTLESNLSSRPRPSPLPPTPYTGTSEHPVAPKSNSNSLLWSVPAYKPPPPPRPPSAESRNPTITTTATTNAPPRALLKQPSIPNIHAPIANPLPTTTTTSTITAPQTSTPTTPTPTPAAPTPKPRQRESKWTGAQLANLASALESAFFPAAAAAFAAENKKTAKQVRETYSFLVNGRIFEFSDDNAGGDTATTATTAGGGGGGGDGAPDASGKGKCKTKCKTNANGNGNGNATGNENRTKVARRFEKELKEHRKMNERTMKEVHRREAREGHWACVGMGVGQERGGKGQERKEMGKGKGKGMGGGVLAAVVGEGGGGR